MSRSGEQLDPSSSRPQSTMSSSTANSSSQGEQRSKRVSNRTIGDVLPDQASASSGDSPRSRYSAGGRKDRPRNSGGFLLDSVFGSIRPSKNSVTIQVDRLPDVAMDLKGKRRRSEDADGLTKRRSWDPGHRHLASSPMGNSPLRKEVINPEDHVDNPDHQTAFQTSHEGDIVQLDDVAGEESGSAPLDLHDVTSASHLSSDATQLVNLALSLNESRRRQTSGGQYTVNGAPENEPKMHRAQVATNPRRQNSSARRVSQPQSPRHPSRKVSAAVTTASKTGPVPSFLDGQLEHGQSYNFDEQFYNFSPATQARVAKAKLRLELSAEYRRLLQHVPPLTPPGGAPNSPTPFDGGVSGVDTDLGRDYNPLQAIRNRKVRARERLSIDFQQQGWNDLDHVKDWVEKVKAESQKPGFITRDKVLLPSLDTNVEIGEESLHGDSENIHVNSRSLKSSGLRTDWDLNPEELLADLYWLESGNNKQLIEDKNGHKIFQSDSSGSNAGGAAGRFPIDSTGGGSGRFSVDSQGRERRFSISLNKSREERASDHKVNDMSLDDADKKLHRTRYSWRRGRLRSKSPSTSPSDKESIASEQRSRRVSAHENDDLYHSLLEKQMLRTLDKDALEPDYQTRQIEVHDFQALEGTDHPKKLSTNNNGKKRDSRDAGSLHGQSESMSGDHLRGRDIGSQSPGVETDTTDAHSLYGPDAASPESTANLRPKHPLRVTEGFPPSITIDLSPPLSRQESPSRRSGFRSLGEKDDGHFSGNDSAYETDRFYRRRFRSSDVNSRHKGTSSISRASSPVKNLLERAKTVEVFGKDLLHSENKKSRSQESNEKSNETDHLRGFFKGGKLDEFVKSEVSKVSDLVRRKDPSPAVSRKSSIGHGYLSSQESSEPEESPPMTRGLRPRPRDAISSRKTENVIFGPLPENEAGGSKSQYHLRGLPTFTSSSGRDRIAPHIDISSSEADHISHQKMVQRAQRSPRFDRLAPPQLDVRSMSSSPSRDLSRTRRHDSSFLDQNQGDYFGGANDAPFHRVRSADERLNAILSYPGTIGGPFKPPVTGLARLEASAHPGSTESEDQLHKKYQPSRRGSIKPNMPPSKRELERVRVLLLSSAIKANEICHRAQEVRPAPFSSLNSLRHRPLPPVPRSQEHILAARVICRDIQLSRRLFDECATNFSSRAVDGLNGQITKMRQLISSRLAPLVRNLADDADNFGVELTTTHTLAVKHLNDNIDAMLRRRRRRLRWIRRTGYVLLEWMLLGIMWWVWLVVMIVRVFRAMFRGTANVVRWVLWL